MSALAYPALSIRAPSRWQWRLASSVQMFKSPLSSATRTLGLPGDRWMLSARYELLDEADSALFESWLTKLSGSSGRFLLYPMHRPRPRGTVIATPLVNGANQPTGNTLVMDGCGASKTLLAGDFLSVNGELKQLIADTVSDGSGNLSAIFSPPLRASPPDNAAVTLIKPTATFMLTADVALDFRAGLVASAQIDAVEQFVQGGDQAGIQWDNGGTIWD